MMESSGSDNEYRPPEKKRKEERSRNNKSPVPLTSSCISTTSTTNWCSDLPKDVSRFKLIHLERLGLFYAENPESSLENLFNKSMSCVVEIPELDSNFKFVADFLKEYLFFNASHYTEHKDKKKFMQDMLNINENSKKLKEFLIDDFLSRIGVNKSKERQLVRILEDVHVASREFMEMVMYFMDEDLKKSSSFNFCLEMMYRELFSSFFQACGLSVRAGECVKKSLILSSGHAIISVPDLRCKLNRQMFLESDGKLAFIPPYEDTMMIVGEVKTRKRERIECENFSIIRDLGSYDVLGQLGAELLVELQDTCFIKKEGGNRLVFGAICAGTQIIFTALEMTPEHLDAIVECDVNKSDEDDLGKALIHYTRPYDLLKASDRQLLYEPMVRLACVQKHLKAFSSKNVNY